MNVLTTANKLVSDPPAGEIVEIEDHVDRQFRSFKNFDVVENLPSDHYYIEQADIASFSSSLVCIMNFRSPFTRNGGVDGAARKERITKEWELLRTSLPNSIFVRAYSARPELMRAAIIGLRHNNDGSDNGNNPYAHGLFFFDIMLPAQYPAKPPLINYRFNGVDLGVSRFTLTGPSRNLSCFREEGSEAKWDPERSSVLHALGVIQRGVLARGQQMKGEKRNEVFMLAHEAMGRTLRDPPDGFEDLVKGYFRKFSHVILMQLKEYVENQGLRKSISGVGQGKLTFQNLFNDFVRNGSYCRHIKLDLSKLG